ncbi:HpcH/HpaI aldolase family protein [Bacilliculturomica massiliensis]|uniref:HpcH/HpaI aldolase family protein n=1 Tax=Bacilliculturomica massiliensis TaxID=1917867 RepID=UPI00102FAADC|nr:aldolase/citrate lyase family protein [Bacilliculturomica massiliensis]
MKIKERLKNKETVYGTFVKLNCPQIVEMLSFAGLDFIIIDMEHSTISHEAAENLMRAAGDMDVIVRVPAAAEEHVLHALDAGASGVQVPGLQRASEAEQVVGWGKYFPMGGRGLSFAQRSARYGFVDKDQYIEEKNEESLFVFHIENKEMVEEIDRLCENPQVDVLFIGPMDLSQSYGTPGNAGSEPVQKAIQTVMEAAKRHDKAVGIFAAQIGDIEKYKRQGIQYIAAASDIGFCKAGASEYMKTASALQESAPGI